MDLAADKLTNFSTKNPRMGKVLEAYLLACAFNPANLLLIPLTLLLPFILALDTISPFKDVLKNREQDKLNQLSEVSWR